MKEIVLQERDPFLEGLAGVAAGFAGIAVAKAVKSNIQDGRAMAQADFVARQRIAMAGDEDIRYQDWLKHGPRYENGYFVPRD